MKKLRTCLSHVRGKVRPDKDGLDALDRQRLADNQLGCGRHVSEPAVLLFHEEGFARVVVPGVT